MKTRIICDKEYARSFRGNLNEIEFESIWERIVSLGEQFYNNQYKPNITAIIDIVPRYSGFKWCEFAPTELPIFLVDKVGPSISNPLTLKIKQDLEHMLTVLIHELTHINLPLRLVNDEFYYEEIINQITVKTCQILGTNSGIDTINSYRREREKQGLVFENLPLDKYSIRTLLKSGIASPQLHQKTL